MTVIGLIKIEPSERGEELLRLLEPHRANDEVAETTDPQTVPADLDRLSDELRRELGDFRSRIADPLVRRATI